MVVSAGRLTEEMRNSYRYFREGFSGKYLDLYVIMENGVFVIIVKYTLYIYFLYILYIIFLLILLLGFL